MGKKRENTLFSLEECLGERGRNVLRTYVRMNDGLGMLRVRGECVGGIRKAPPGVTP